MLNKLKELRESREEGFTLIELLVVIVIIGVLAAIALPIFLNQQKAAIQAGVKSDVKSIQTVVATHLVKKPTEAALGYTVSNATTSILGQNVAVSDAGTTISIAGKWDTWSVTGTNSNVPGYSYSYDSKTGAYSTSGD